MFWVNQLRSKEIWLSVVYFEGNAAQIQGA